MIDDGTFAMVIYGIEDVDDGYTLKIADPHIFENFTGNHGLYTVKLNY